jgi:hypothetical protein
MNQSLKKCCQNIFLRRSWAEMFRGYFFDVLMWFTEDNFRFEVDDKKTLETAEPAVGGREGKVENSKA